MDKVDIFNQRVTITFQSLRLQPGQFSGSSNVEVSWSEIEWFY